MLTITTMKNPLAKDSEKDGYCFRSSCSQNLSVKKLAEEMTGYNSSFTEADNMGMLSVLNTVVVKYLAKGYNVELPFGSLRANATGTCRTIQDGFVLGSGNNQLGFLFNANSDTTGRVRTTLEYRQMPPDIRGEAKLYRVTVLQSDASESTVLSVSAGKTLRLHGRNLSFDIDDAEQGVFLENAEGRVRLSSYNRRGSNIVDVVIPQDLSPGSYDVSIVTKPGTSYFTAVIDSPVTVS